MHSAVNCQGTNGCIACSRCRRENFGRSPEHDEFPRLTLVVYRSPLSACPLGLWTYCCMLVSASWLLELVCASVQWDEAGPNGMGLSDPPACCVVLWCLGPLFLSFLFKLGQSGEIWLRLKRVSVSHHWGYMDWGRRGGGVRLFCLGEDMLVAESTGLLTSNCELLFIKCSCLRHCRPSKFPPSASLSLSLSLEQKKKGEKKTGWCGNPE
jgi:hypothetical protein